MRNLAIVFLVFFLGCGGAANTPCPSAPPTNAAPPASSAPAEAAAKKAAPVASTAAPFTGSFDVTSMSDSHDQVDVARVIEKMNAVDGRMTWQIGKDSFGVGLWVISAPLKDRDDEHDRLYAFCRAQGTVSAHWEGMTLVLASTISSQGGSDAIHVVEKVDGPKTTRRTLERNNSCSASFSGLRITFSIVDKDDAGPTRLRAESEGTVVELARGMDQSKIVPKEILDAKK